MAEPVDRSMSALTDAAFRAAAVQVLRRAKQTGTPVIVWRDGEIRAIPPEEFDERDFLPASKGVIQERPPAAG